MSKLLIEISGLAAWYLLALQVLLGAVYAGGLGRLLIAPRAKLQLHIWVSSALLGLVTLHIGTVLITFFHGWDGVFKALVLSPGTPAHTFGVLALWSLLIVPAARWRPARIALGPRTGRYLHRLAYLTLCCGTVHALLAGSNTRSLLVAGPGIAALSALATAGLARYHKHLARRRTARTTARRRPRHLQAAGSGASNPARGADTSRGAGTSNTGANSLGRRRRHPGTAANNRGGGLTAPGGFPAAFSDHESSPPVVVSAPAPLANLFDRPREPSPTR